MNNNSNVISFEKERAVKNIDDADDCCNVTARDILLTALHGLESGEILVDTLIVCCINKDGTSRYLRKASSQNVAETLGLLERTKFAIMGAKC